MATKFEFISTADPTQRDDLIQNGTAVTLTIQANGQFTVVISVPGSPDDVSNGTLAVSGGSITLTEAGDAATGSITVAGSTMTLNLTTGVEHDFDNDGTDDPATADLVFVRI